MTTLQNLNLEKLTLVVGDEEIKKHPNIMFIKPRQIPHQFGVTTMITKEWPDMVKEIHDYSTHHGGSRGTEGTVNKR